MRIARIAALALSVMSVLPAVAESAEVTLYTGYGCSGASMTISSGNSDFRNLYYSCVRQRSGCRGECDIEYSGQCKINDKVRSLRIRGNTPVYLYKHPNYRGDIEVYQGTACQNLGRLAGEASALTIGDRRYPPQRPISSPEPGRKW